MIKVQDSSLATSFVGIPDIDSVCVLIFSIAFFKERARKSHGRRIGVVRGPCDHRSLDPACESWP
jgi:hypothetical protein